MSTMNPKRIRLGNPAYFFGGRVGLDFGARAPSPRILVVGFGVLPPAPSVIGRYPPLFCSAIFFSFFINLFYYILVYQQNQEYILFYFPRYCITPFEGIKTLPALAPLPSNTHTSHTRADVQQSARNNITCRRSAAR
jgi:hypothetical protein